jgi:hypothetical protein
VPAASCTFEPRRFNGVRLDPDRSTVRFEAAKCRVRSLKADVRIRLFFYGLDMPMKSSEIVITDISSLLHSRRIFFRILLCFNWALSFKYPFIEASVIAHPEIGSQINAQTLVTKLCYEYNSNERGLEMAPIGVYLAHEQGE